MPEQQRGRNASEAPGVSPKQRRGASNPTEIEGGVPAQDEPERKPHHGPGQCNQTAPEEQRPAPTLIEGDAVGREKNQTGQ